MVALGDRVSGLFGNDDEAVGRFEHGQRAGRRGVLAPADPRRDGREGPRQLQDRRPRAAQHRALGRGVVRRGLPARVRRRRAVGCTSTSPARPTTRRPPYGHVTAGGTGVSVATLVELARDLAESSPTDGSSRAGSAAAPQLVPARGGPGSGAGCRHASARGSRRPPRRTTASRWPLANVVRPLHRRHPTAGPLAVVGDQQHRDVADRRARLDEPLDPRCGCGRTRTRWALSAESAIAHRREAAVGADGGPRRPEAGRAFPWRPV